MNESLLLKEKHQDLNNKYNSLTKEKEELKNSGNKLNEKYVILKQKLTDRMSESSLLKEKHQDMNDEFN